MTITLDGRKLTFVTVAAMGLLAAYLLGSSRSGATVASAATIPARVAALTTTGTTAGITVTGTGTVSGVPDTLRLDMSIVVSGATIDSALAAANQTSAAVQHSLLKHGVAPKDLQTTSLYIQPNYVAKGQARSYQVDESMSAKLRNLHTAGGIVSAAVAAGGNSTRVDGLSLELEDTGRLVSAARTSAFDDAKTKAEQYARAAGRSVGPVISINDSVQTDAPTPVSFGGFAAASAPAMAVPIQAGSQNVSVQVTVVFGLQ
jgi:uncharacterized protein